MEQNEFTELGNFKSLHQADLAQEILESNDINCFVVGSSEDVLDMADVQNIRVRISKDDQQKATQILDTFFPEGWK
jgi:hypothetical protein